MRKMVNGTIYNIERYGEIGFTNKKKCQFTICIERESEYNKKNERSFVWSNARGHGGAL